MSEVRQGSATAGVVAWAMVAITTLGLCAVFTGWVSPAGIPLLGAWLIALGVGMFISGLVDLKRGDLLGGTMMMVLASCLNWGTGASFLTATWAQVNQLPLDGRLNGAMIIGVVVFLALSLLVIAKVSRVIFISVIVLIVGLGLAAAGIFGGVAPGTGAMYTSGILIGVFSLFCFYFAVTIFVNTFYGRPKLSLGPPVIK